MTLILDSSVVITALTYESRQGHWSRQRILSDDLVAPHVMPLEVASALRFAAMRSEISSNIATSAYADLLSFQIELFPFGGLASRI